MPINNIMLAYDGSPESKRSIKTCFEVAKQFNSTVYVVNCILSSIRTPWFEDSGADDEFFNEQKIKAKKEMEKIQSEAKKSNINTETCIFRTKNIPLKLLQFVKNKKIDLAILGNHNHGTLVSVVLGTVVNDFVKKTKCPVMLIR